MFLKVTEAKNPTLTHLIPVDRIVDVIENVIPPKTMLTWHSTVVAEHSKSIFEVHVVETVSEIYQQLIDLSRRICAED